MRRHHPPLNGCPEATALRVAAMDYRQGALDLHGDDSNPEVAARNRRLLLAALAYAKAVAREGRTIKRALYGRQS